MASWISNSAESQRDLDAARDADVTESMMDVESVATAAAAEPELVEERSEPIPLAVPSWLISMALHLGAVLLLALLSVQSRDEGSGILMLGAITDGSDQGPELQALANLPLDSTNDNTVEIARAATVLPTFTEDATADSATPTFAELNQPEQWTPFADVGVSMQDFVESTGNGMNLSGVSGRSGDRRSELLQAGGGTEGSEAAVRRALEWFERHQNPDGSWSFHSLDGKCDCKNHGSLDSAHLAATSMALLPFLGAGHTHEEGKYRDVVKQGLYFLRNQQADDGALIEPDGRLYSHGLATIALCEAYAMTRDRGLQNAAQLALDHISFAQDPSGGGWRYVPHEPGDTSVTGWMVMSIKSGRMAYLSVANDTVSRAKQFLDSVQADNGSAYGYLNPGDKVSTSAVGLLCRMYMGWDKENEALQRGVERLSRIGPSREDLYYDYYATQVMRHNEGELWEKWNRKMRDWLVTTQMKRGHESGSWYVRGDVGAVQGGRHYCTSLATMILEVYYRHLPLYGQQAIDENFPL